jgi:hypothetical protein
MNADDDKFPVLIRRDSFPGIVSSRVDPRLAYYIRTLNADSIDQFFFIILFYSLAPLADSP